MLKEAIVRPRERPHVGESLVLRGYELRGHERPQERPRAERGHEGRLTS